MVSLCKTLDYKDVDLCSCCLHLNLSMIPLQTFGRILFLGRCSVWCSNSLYFVLIIWIILKFRMRYFFCTMIKFLYHLIIIRNELMIIWFLFWGLYKHLNFEFHIKNATGEYAVNNTILHWNHNKNYNKM